MDGTIWLAKNAPEQGETAAFVKAAQEPDFFMGIPVLAKKSPGQAKGMSEVVKPPGAPGPALRGGRGNPLPGHRPHGGTVPQDGQPHRRDLRQIRPPMPLKDEVFEIPKGYKVVRP
jgi:hypothetical protein